MPVSIPFCAGAGLPAGHGRHAVIGEGVEAGGKAVGAGFMLLILMRSSQWLIGFLAGRHDTRQERLEAREARLDKSIGERVGHLEKQVEEMGRALQDCLAAANILVAEMLVIDNANPKIAEARHLMARAFRMVPFDEVDFEFDAILRKIP